MTQDRWRRVYSLYERALEQPADARAALLESERSRDSETVDEVLRLLDLSAKAGDFLEISPVENPRQLASPPPVFQIGEQVGDRFRVEEHLGTGGMGDVYRARDCDLNVDVAIKTVHLNRLGDPSAQERLRHEALVARLVTHRNVCRIYDVFRHRLGQGEGEVVVLAMELLRGPTLQGYLAQKGPLSENEALEIVLQLCAGLEAAHAQGIIHRDFKSANVILTSDSHGLRAVITDFGLARPFPVSGGQSSTHSGLLVGTLDYMAPELLRGQPASVQSDLYALGVLLFEMVTGAMPHPGVSSIDQILKRFLDPPASPRTVAPSVSRKWDAVTRQCLDCEPRRRGRSSTQIASQLRSRTSGLVATGNRRRFLIGASAASLAAAAGLVWQSRRPVRVIVFAIENQSGDPGLNYLCQGITTELIRQLVRTQGVRIVPYYAPKPKTPASLPAAYTLAGTLQIGSSLRVELADAADGAIIWSEQFEGGSYRNPLQVQIELARAVVRAFQTVRPAGPRLAGFFSSPAPEAPLTQNSEAFDLYMRAVNLLRERTLAPTLTASEYLQRAIGLDPHFALAYAAMAEVQTALIDSAYAPTTELMLRGHGYAERAVREGPYLPETHLVLASFRQMAWDWDGSADSYRESLRLRPDFARALQWYAGLRLQFGASREILADLKQAVEIDPYDPIVRNGYSLGLFFSDKYAEAVRVQEELAILKNSTLARHQLGNIYAYQGSISSGAQRAEFFRLALAQAAAVDDLENRPENPAGAGLRIADRMYSLFYSLAGRAQEAAPYLQRLESQLPAGLTSPGVIARAYAALGHFDRALDLIELGLSRKDRALMYLKVNPFFRSLYPQPRFQQYLHTMQL